MCNDNWYVSKILIYSFACKLWGKIVHGVFVGNNPTIDNSSCEVFFPVMREKCLLGGMS